MEFKTARLGFRLEGNKKSLSREALFAALGERGVAEASPGGGILARSEPSLASDGLAGALGPPNGAAGGMLKGFWARQRACLL